MGFFGPVDLFHDPRAETILAALLDRGGEDAKAIMVFGLGGADGPAAATTEQSFEQGHEAASCVAQP